MDSINKIKIHNQSRISDCRIITLDRHQHANGNLTAINNGTATTRATSSSSPSAAALT